MTISKRETELAAYLERQPYQVEQDGIHLTIAKNVFPSDFGLTSKFFGQYMLQQPPADYGLDMGCGSGYFAFLLKKIGCKQVIGVDFNPDAVNCAEENRTLNPHLTPIEFVHSDLFASVPPQKFGIIVFNFNYYPSNGNFGLNADGGREILQRFFSQVDDYLDTDARIYIPYSEFVGDEHDPAKIAEDFGFKVTVVAETENHAGRHFKYLLVKS
jgi:methylase of polypeptide subunit release factors